MSTAPALCTTLAKREYTSGQSDTSAESILSEEELKKALLNHPVIGEATKFALKTLDSAENVNLKVEIGRDAILKRGVAEVKNELYEDMLDKVYEQLDAKDQQLADKEQNIGKLTELKEHYEKKFGPVDNSVLDAIDKKYALFAVKPKPRSERFVIDLCRAKNRLGLPSSSENTCHKPEVIKR
jgi:hypothetical protein